MDSDSPPIGARRAGSYQQPTPSTGPRRDAEGSSGAPSRGRPAAGRPHGCWPHGCWAPSEQRGGSAGRARGKVELGCRPAGLSAASGRCEDHLAAAMRRPRPRASPVQHPLLRLGLRRVLLHALGGGWGGVLAARCPPGARRVCTHQSTRRPQQAAARSSSCNRRAVAPRRAARAGARRLSAKIVGRFVQTLAQDVNPHRCPNLKFPNWQTEL